MSFTVSVDHHRLDVRLGKITPDALIALRSTVETLDAELVDAAKALAPAKSGHYRDSIKGSVRSGKHGVVGTVSSASPMAHIIEGGATIPPHDITPDVARALHFGGSAGDVFAAHVHSPGATLPGRHVIGGAFDAMQAQIRSDIETSVRGAVRAV